MDPGEMSRERDTQTDRELLLEDIEEMYDKQAKNQAGCNQSCGSYTSGKVSLKR